MDTRSVRLLLVAIDRIDRMALIDGIDLCFFGWTLMPSSNDDDDRSLNQSSAHLLCVLDDDRLLVDTRSITLDDDR